MISTSPLLEQWCRHKAGEQQILNTKGIHSITEAVDLNQNAEQIISSYGNTDFEALVGFVDMRGFSSLAQGKSPSEVRDTVRPFISAVVDAATSNHCFIDKTIGDEVMLVMPIFDRDTVLSDAQMPTRGLLEVDLTALLADVIRRLRRETSRVTFSAGFARGYLTLDRVGGGQYGE
ncbi:MAG TPA: hypothetical protein VF345_15215 [Chthoniobacterales bacterium]